MTGSAAMSAIRKISHAVYETPDPAQQAEYYTDVIGLTMVERAAEEVFLSSTGEHHSVILRRGNVSRCVAIGFQIGPDDDLGDFEKKVAAHGVNTRRATDAQPTIGEMLVFDDIKGTRMEVFRAPEPLHHPYTKQGVVPHKLGHIAFHVEDVQKATSFYTEVLGFRVSDWMGDFFSFLRCGPDHHTINLVGTGTNAHFHTAFELRDWSHLQGACDILSMAGYRIIWGPGRHGIGHNLFTYHRGPNGLITELFTELDQMPDESLGYYAPRPWHRDNPQRPKVWQKGPQSANLWGPPPPDEMMKL
jgi:catechol-2,3-dioxygenase